MAKAAVGDRLFVVDNNESYGFSEMRVKRVEERTSETVYVCTNVYGNPSAEVVLNDLDIGRNAFHSARRASRANYLNTLLA